MARDRDGAEGEKLLLDALAEAVRIRRELEAHEHTLVAILRARRPPTTWQTIGDVYGQTDEGARRRFRVRAGPSRG